MRPFVFAAILAVFCGPVFAQTATFENLSFSTTTPNYENGTNLSGSFSSGGSTFTNTNFSPTYWSGFSYSRVNNVTVNSYTNQYAAYDIPSGGTGHNSATYAVAYNFSPGDARINLPTNTRPGSISITNSTYAALTVRDGDPNGFARPFANGDFFKLTILGYNAQNQSTGSVEFYLADYRGNQSIIIDRWTTVNLSALGDNTAYLLFSLESTDNHPEWGMNTPAYFAIDNFTATPIPEPASILVAGLAGMLILGRTRRRSQLASHDSAELCKDTSSVSCHSGSSI